MESYLGSAPCSCGREHQVAIDDVVTGSGVVNQLPAFVAKYNAKKPFVFADVNTYAAAGETVCRILKENGIAYESYVFPQKELEPDEHAVGAAIMYFDPSCDLIIAVGSGVLNDICKIVSNISGRKYIIVATAPSMDGYASATSSMARSGLKTSINSRVPDVIIGDIDILKQAPEHMLKSGLGDMLAKYVSIAEWRIGHLITGEYYCESVAQLIRDALKKCTDNAAGLLKRDEAAIQAVFEGLVIGGVSMAYAGVSRPASGMEHYISHILDMQALEFGTASTFHGIQCGVGTLVALQAYEKLRSITPDKEKALAHAKVFSLQAHEEQLRKQLGKGAEAMIAGEAKEGKYDAEKHAERLERLLAEYDRIKACMEKLPSEREMTVFLEKIGHPTSGGEFGVSEDAMREAFLLAEDIRDKYVLGRLLWDLGLLEEFAKELRV